MPREEALKRLAQLLAERIKTSSYADVLKPVQSFREIPPASKFWALPTGESVTWPMGKTHHGNVIDELGFRRPARFTDTKSSLSGMESAIQSGLIRGESGPEGELSMHLGQRPEALLAAMNLIRTHRPERAWVNIDARVPGSGVMEGGALKYDWSRSGDMMRKLTRLYEASKNPEQFLATLRAMRTMGLLPLGLLPFLRQNGGVEAEA